MSSLFVINRSWHQSSWLFEQLAFASKKDAILLIEDAVLALHSPITLASFLAKCSALQISVFALLNDVELRGINNQYESINLVDYSGFVDLVVSHQKQVTW